MNWPTDNAGIVLMILSHEGGYCNLSNDHGGPTNMGITIDTLASWRKKDVSAADIKALTVKEASDIFTYKYIVTPNFDQLTDIRLRASMTDFGVLFGPVRAVQALQLVLGQKVDSQCGPITLGAANASAPRRLINQLSGIRIQKHVDRVTIDPTQLQFLRGWVSRALSFVE